MINGYSTNDTVCVSDSNGGGNLKCAKNRLFGVITEQVNFNVTQVDGLLGMGRIVPGSNDNRTQFVLGLVNETDPNLI